MMSKYPVEFAQVTGKSAQQDEREEEKNLKEPDVKRQPLPQQTIEHTFSLWSEDGQRTSDSHRAIMHFICVDVQPLMAVEKAGFQTSSSQECTIREHCLFLITNTSRSSKKELAMVESVAVSFDLFSDEGNVHQIIGTVVAVISDGASNVALAGALREVDNWDCLSHKLNLAAKQDRAMTASAVIPLVNLMISEGESSHEDPVATQAIASKLKIELRKYEKVEC
ncbi:unnamed protein product [Heligmosomoides polygyrus]|uniref:Zinc finger protein 862 n=1 Tax=Heligmosomoides polygyrus TaxID=6339 RepID=A0A183G538_HELPZ|nr:unnamed protein product [Heligmosomoides polygyrus]